MLKSSFKEKLNSITCLLFLQFSRCYDISKLVMQALLNQINFPHNVFIDFVNLGIINCSKLMILKYKLIQDDTKKISKKKHKIKKKNQYSQPFSFQQQDNEELTRKLTLLQSIPKCIQYVETFCLDNNFQLPLKLNKNFQLGALTVDPYLQNYKAIRIDKKRDIYIVTYELIERGVISYEQFYELVGKVSPFLQQGLSLFNQRFVRIQNKEIGFQTTDQKVTFDEKMTSNPFNGYVCRHKDGKSQTLQRIFNKHYLNLLGIDEEMLYHYFSETRLLPFLLYFDPSLNELAKCLKKISNNERCIMNYQGEKQYLKTELVQFVQEEKGDIMEYNFYVYFPNQKISQYQLEQNINDYWNGTRQPSFSELPNKSLMCGYKRKDQQ